MKRIYFFAALLLVIPLAYAVTETKEKMNINSQATVAGKTLTVLYATTEGSIKLDVDGKKGMAVYGELGEEINGMRVKVTNFTYIDADYVEITMELTVDFQCGDGLCDTNLSESKENCCKDCGCLTGQCINNICTTAECQEDKDCNDDNNCTKGICNGQKKCEITNITECKSNDFCCPGLCEYENDNDCEKEPEGECENDAECDDNNSCTTDRCEGNITECTHQSMEGCDYKGICYNTTERAENVYCTGEGIKQQKENKEDCNNDYECLENMCTKNICGKESRKGVYIGGAVAILTLIALTFLGFTIFRKKKQDLYPDESSKST